MAQTIWDFRTAQHAWAVSGVGAGCRPLIASWVVAIDPFRRLCACVCSPLFVLGGFFACVPSLSRQMVLFGLCFLTAKNGVSKASPFIFETKEQTILDWVI